MNVKIYKFLFFCFIYFCSFALFANNGEYQTLTFLQAAELAVSASADLKYSRASQAIMEKMWVSGIREYFPRISFNVSENDRLQQLGADSFIKNFGIGIDQLLFDGGRISMSRKIEQTELNLSSSRIDRMESDIGEAAISAYRNILSSRAILDIKNSALKILEEQIDILREEVQLGLVLPVDLISAQINFADAKLDIYSLQLDLTEIEKQFAELLGLEVLPVLAETVDINRPAVLIQTSAVVNLAREQNPDLIEARFFVTKRRAELSYLSRSWIPIMRINGNFGLSGSRYPLTRYNWSVGINIDLLSPWIQNRFNASTGWEPLSHEYTDRTAIVQNSFSPINDPASGYRTKQAKLALDIEQEKYNTAFERIGRIAHNAIEKYALAEEKRKLAIDVAAIGEERCRIEELRLGLGQITRLKMMEVLIEQIQREIAVVEAAIFLLEAERELERFLDLEPGELKNFAALINDSL